MKILSISDIVLTHLSNRENLLKNYNQVQAVISCGDLPVDYLEYITGVLNVPLLYVRGNHDIYYTADRPGGDDLHGRVIRLNNYLIAGLQGCMRYNREPLQYSDNEMLRMVFGLWPTIRYATLRRRRRLDLMVTHSPAWKIHDLPDRAHQGFKSFRLMIRLYRPRMLIHGHVDNVDKRLPSRTTFAGTEILNINPVKLLDLSEIRPQEAMQTATPSTIKKDQ